MKKQVKKPLNIDIQENKVFLENKGKTLMLGFIRNNIFYENYHGFLEKKVIVKIKQNFASIIWNYPYNAVAQDYNQSYAMPKSK